MASLAVSETISQLRRSVQASRAKGVSDELIPMAPKVVHHAKAVVPVELPDLRSKVKLELFKMELSAEVMHAKELLKGEKRPGHGVLNPTIVI